MTERPFRFPRGEFKGELITRLTVKTLRKMVANDGPYAEEAMAELKRRNIQKPWIVISDHAVNQASVRFWEIYRIGMNKGEGIIDWLQRLCEGALKDGTRDPIGEITTADGRRCIRCHYQAMIFLFTTQTRIPVLVTIMSKDERNRQREMKHIEIF